MKGWRVALLVALLAGLMAGASVPAFAHPHVWVSVRSQMIFDAQGRVSALRHFWTFDEAYSAYEMQGLSPPGILPNREQLAPMAKTNVESLGEFGYFTVLKLGSKQVELAKPINEHLDAGPDKRLTLTFDLPLVEPIAARPVMTLRVYDPEFFVQFDFAENDALSLSSAPQGCTNSANKPKALDAVDTQRLKDVANSNESPGANFGLKLATAIMVACP